MDINVIWLRETDSTNEYVKRHAEDLSPRDVVVTTRQTAGKGTHGRSFFSEGGLYFSFLLKNPPEERVPYVTRMVAVATQHALENDFGVETRVKWVNDLVIDGKKACGILCERTADGNVVVGIGLNLNEPEGGFPDEIKDTACALFSYPLPREEREEIVAAVRYFFDVLYEDAEPWMINAGYDELLYGKNRRVAVMTEDDAYEGVLVGVDDDGYLLVSGDDGTKRFFGGTLRFI